jgi:nitrate/TMAO reductase-like tetraheme cytochrome c subunit
MKEKDPEKETGYSGSIHETAGGTPRPSLFRNYISYFGLAILGASVTSFILLILIEFTSPSENPYTGLITFIAIPTIVVVGLLITAAGLLWERHRRLKMTEAQIAAFPVIDLNNPKRRRALLIFMGISFIFLFISAFVSYRAFEHTESVTFCGQTCHEPMKPEFTSYLAGAHARVRCVDCHVGGGAGWYVRSKLSGAYQLYSVTFNKYSRPIGSPVHNLRPAPETCEQCHWPEKFFGAQMKVFNRYGNDIHNTLRQTRLLINVGGGSPKAGQVTGIHWHMNIANEVTYLSTDEKRQEIPWVRIKDMYGNVTEYVDRLRPMSRDQIASGNMRTMDCVDCHNRPAHVFQPPDTAVDESFSAGKLDPSIPFLKRQAVEALSRQYDNSPQALESISRMLYQFYQVNYPDVFTQKKEALDTAVAETQRIYETYFFPEMKTNWETHPNNLGHRNSVGCFRCHDGRHESNTGKVISNDCNICHTVLYDSAGPPANNAKTGPFQHPVDLGGLASRRCDSCHKPDVPFKHPINLGNISMFQCVACHPR